MVMCAPGTTVAVHVPVPADLAWEGELTWKMKPIDSCIAPIVLALNEGGVFTRSCCCGHFKRRPEIVLADHTVLVLFPDPQLAEVASRLPKPSAACQWCGDKGRYEADDGSFVVCECGQEPKAAT